ncbi:sigma-70 family RNA polymerase sigma factor [Clostridium sp. C105KSO13]|uniref:sigma-70 family RNA polymerase sigma factor n=1 Tax=Clostridium sp. C105KSO13 TaxID=1776045 RepID=UPI0007406A93|nr:sigma-70 family RNA polymerase sigma factor [Clostridium sp. C105KSO13]CUX25545.1 flagellar biosynthesis sigma factor [Clostridium sp. C105KSO13]
MMTDEQRHLVEQYLYLAPRMVSALTRTCPGRAYQELDDLEQIGYLALCRAAMSYDGTRSFKTYAQVVIKHAIFDHWRHMSYQKERFCSLDAMSSSDRLTYEQLSAEESADTATPEQDTMHRMAEDYLKLLETQSCDMIQKGIASLCLQGKGYTSSDLAKLYGVPSNRVRAWQSKARKLLRQDKELYALLT